MGEGFQGFDWQGFGIAVGAIAAAVPIVGGFVLQVLDRIDKKHRELDAQRREQKIDQIGKNVDGLTEHAVAMALRTGTAEGHAKGVADERANPQVSGLLIADPPPTGA